MALEPLYGVFASVARSWGGNTLDGLRAVNALAVATAAVCLAVVIHRTRATIWATILVVLAWLATADVLFLIRTVEDDCLSLAWMAGLLCCCTLPPARWNPVTAMIGGTILGAGALTNYALITWAPVIIAVAVLYAPSDIPLIHRRRILSAGAVVAGFFIPIACWGIWVHSYDPASWSWAKYAHAVFSSPNADFSARDGTLDLFLRYVARNPLDTVLPSGWYPGVLLERSTLASRLLPPLMAAAAVTGIVWPLRHGLQHATAAGRLVSVCCFALLVCTIPAAWKGDPSQYERMNHVPLCLAALAGAGLSTLVTQSRRLAAGLLAGVVVAVLLVNAYAVVAEPRGQSWLARFDAMRRSSLRATTFVFAESEFQSGDFEKLASLSFALPNHLVLSQAGDIRRWPFTPVNHVLVDDYLVGPPSWPRVSPAAARLIELRRPRARLDGQSH
jgi:hypothetical protein